MTKDEKIAYYEDMLGITEDRERYARLKAAFPMSPGAIWMLSRMVAARGRWLPKQVLLDAMPALDPAKERGWQMVTVRVYEIRQALGGKHTVERDAVLGVRLSLAAFWYVEEVVSCEPRR